MTTHSHRAGAFPPRTPLDSRLGGALIVGAVDVEGSRYLGTFGFDATGVVMGGPIRVEVRVGEDSFLRDTSTNGIGFSGVEPTIVSMDWPRRRSGGDRRVAAETVVGMQYQRRAGCGSARGGSDSSGGGLRVKERTPNEPRSGLHGHQYALCSLP